MNSSRKAAAGGYRADIDGLRAIAVSLVVMFHLNMSFVPSRMAPWVSSHLPSRIAVKLLQGPRGGFTGVDIFFVISGFLIGGILMREHESGTFSIVRFYERRIRRILPALMAMLAVLLALGCLSLTPFELVELAKSQLAAVFSVANFYFWKKSGYFDLRSFSRPLLHTWSLAVEEQFYLFFPLILLGIYRYFPKYLKTILVLLAVSSFVPSAIGVYTSPDRTFYFPGTRAWELLTGAIVALEIVPPLASAISRNLTSLLGLCLIGYSAIHTNPARFPGVGALAPCLGAALVIYAGIGGPSIVGYLLSTPPVVFVGLISYSLYLWHWPLWLIDRQEYFPGIYLSQSWLLVAIFAVSILSWRFVERPFRKGMPRPQLFAIALAAVVVISTFCLSAIASGGFPRRFSPDELRMAAYPEQGLLARKWGGCFAENPDFLQPDCLALTPNVPNYLLFGDSHAAHLWFGLSSNFPDIHLVEATAAACKPILANLKSDDPVCRGLVDLVFNRFAPAHPVDTVILSAVWGWEDVPWLAETVARFHALKMRVIVLGPIVTYDQPLPDLIVKSVRSRQPGIFQRHSVRSYEEYTSLDSALSHTVLDHGGARYISLLNLVCDDADCLHYAAPDIPLQFDGSHFTNQGSLLVAERVKRSGQFP